MPWFRSAVNVTDGIPAALAFSILCLHFRPRGDSCETALCHVFRRHYWTVFSDFLFVMASICGISKALKDNLQAASSAPLFFFKLLLFLGVAFFPVIQKVLSSYIGVGTIVLRSFCSKFVFLNTKLSRGVCKFPLATTFVTPLVRPTAINA